MMTNFRRNILQIGIHEDQVLLKPYTVFWKWIYQFEKTKLKIVLDGLVDDIQHVGSTAIRSMAAKPIIDIYLSITDSEAAILCVHRIENLGYPSIVKTENYISFIPVQFYANEKEYIIEAMVDKDLYGKTGKTNY